VSKSVDHIIDAIDVGLQSPLRTGFLAGYQGMYMGDVGTCWRCNQPTARGLFLACEPCRAWMSCETDEDPKDVTSDRRVINPGLGSGRSPNRPDPAQPMEGTQ
jgi:hypothetical protein